MSTEEACKYWNGTVIDGGCIGTSGTLWEARWDNTTKSFSCMLMADIYQKEQSEQTVEQTVKQTVLKTVYHVATFNASGEPYDFASELQWDKDLQKCTSAPERRCISEGETYDSNDFVCLSHKHDKERCESVGAKFSTNNSVSSCDCVIGTNSFHWDSTGSCKFISKSSIMKFDSKVSMYAEKCIYNYLINTELFNGQIKKLSCTNK